MRKKLIAFAVVIGIALIPGIAWTAGTSYYGSNYNGNWGNQYGYGYSDGSGGGGTGGNGYVGPGASVDTNPKYQTPIHDESCVGRYQKEDGTVFEQVFAIDVATYVYMWNDETCKNKVVSAYKDAEGYVVRNYTPLAWARAQAGPWNELNIQPLVLTPCQRVLFIDLVDRCREIPAATAGGFGTIRVETVSTSSAGGICSLGGSALKESKLDGNWNLGVYAWNSNTLLCAVEVSRVTSITPPPTTTSTTTPVTQAPVAPSTTTTTAPVTQAPSTSTTTTTVAPSTTTTTAPKPVATTTTTSPPSTTTTTRPAVNMTRPSAEQIVRNALASKGISAYVWSAYGSPNYIVRVDLYQASQPRSQEACITARDALRNAGYGRMANGDNWWIHVYPYGASQVNQIMCNELV